MKLLRENTELLEVNLSEGFDKQLYISGIFAQAEKKNRNGRIYPKAVMEQAVNKYVTEYVNTRRAISEVSHPENRPTCKPELASHLITEFRMEGNDVYGKARILNTPQGQIVRGLLEGGVQLGVSTRGLGSVEERNGTTYVKDDFAITAVDVVSDPSALDAWIQPIMESADWIYVDGRYEQQQIESAQRAIRNASRKQLDEVVLKQFEKFMNTING